MKFTLTLVAAGKQISEMDANQGKFDIIAGAHDDVQAQETAGDQTSQVANIENDTGAHQDAQSKEASPGDLSTQVAIFENDADRKTECENFNYLELLSYADGFLYFPWIFVWMVCIKYKYSHD